MNLRMPFYVSDGFNLFCFILFYFNWNKEKRRFNICFYILLILNRHSIRGLQRECEDDAFLVYMYTILTQVRFTLTKRLYEPYTCFIVVHLTTNDFLYLFMREVCCTLSHFLMHFGHSYDCSIEYFSTRRLLCVLTKRKSNNALKCVFVSVTNAYYWNLLDFN